MYNECNCGNSQSLEIRGPSRRHHPEGTSETASPRFIPSILCSELHREPQFPVPVELLILEMGEMPLATSWAPPASREVIPVPDTPDGLKRSWSFLYIVGCVRARPDTSNGNPWKAWAKIPTQRARTASEVLLVLSELRELFKTLSCISISTRRYRCVRFLFFFLTFISRGGICYIPYFARVVRSMFTICSGGHASDAYCVLLLKLAFVNTWNLSTF